MKKHLSGFVQVLILPFFILGAIAVTVGGYYAVKHIPQSVNKGKVIVDEGNNAEVINNEPVVRVDDGRPNILIEKGTSSPSSVPSQQKISINNKVSSSKQVEAGTNFDSLISQAEVQIKQLDQDKEDFQLLRKTIDEHRQKSMEYATNMMNPWISLIDNNISSVPEEYQIPLRGTRKNLVESVESTKDLTGKYYSLTDQYFVDSASGKSNIDLIILKQKELSDCIKMWKGGEETTSCKIFILGFASDVIRKDSVNIKDAISTLKRADDAVLSMIESSTKIAEDGVTYAVDIVQKIVNIQAFTNSNLDYIQQQVTQGSSQILPSQPKITTSASTCSNPVSKRILVPGKGFISVKQCNNGTYIEESKYVPDTSSMTPQQICDMRKSAWLGQGAIVGSSPDCSDLGL